MRSARLASHCLETVKTVRCAPGQAVLTSGGDLGVHSVIHAVGPQFGGHHDGSGVFTTLVAALRDAN